MRGPPICLLKPSSLYIRHFNLVASYLPSPFLHPSTQPLSTKKNTRYAKWVPVGLAGGLSGHFAPLQSTSSSFSSALISPMEDKQHKDLNDTCSTNLNMEGRSSSISVSPTRRNPNESRSLSTGAKGKARDFKYNEEDGEEGAFAGRRRRGRGKDKGKGKGRGDKINALGRSMTAILRHKAEKLRLNIRSDGYVPVNELLTLKDKTFVGNPLCSHTIDDVKEAVKNDNKQRFSLLEENGQLYIRANQGHTLKVIETEKLLKPILSAEEVPVCVHGTYRKNLESILKTGLSRMQRNHVHFATGLPHDGDVISGMRRDVNTLIYLDVEKALKDGMKLYLSDNKVLLTEGFGGIVTPSYFAKIETWPKREPISLS